MKLDDESSKLLASEIHMMKSSNHPNIVGYLESYIVADELWVKHYFAFLVFNLLMCCAMKL